MDRWMIWRVRSWHRRPVGGEVLTYARTHWSRESAEADAERLNRLHAEDPRWRDTSRVTVRHEAA